MDVLLGGARFVGPSTVEVAGQTLRFKRAVIATGARATEPPIPGLAEVGYLTNETVFSLTQCPSRLAVIGGGPIGCELAQAFQRLGSEVSLLHKNAHLLDREDMDAAAIVQSAFVREGITLLLNAKITRVKRNGGGKIIWYESQGNESSIVVDEILIGTGRAPNGLGRLASVVHPYPTQAEAIRHCGDAYNRTRLTPTVKEWMDRWLAWQRS